MKSTKEFPFERARRITKPEVEAARTAIEKHTGKKRRVRKGRPPKSLGDKYRPISLRLHPRAIAWVKREATRRSVPYQSLINEILLKLAA